MITIQTNSVKRVKILTGVERKQSPTGGHDSPKIKPKS